jgi:hypothetical protein
MNVLIAMLAGLAGGAVSALAGGFLVAGICAALHVSNREGGIGYAALFGGLLAGIIGLIVSIMLTLRWRGQSASAVFAQTPMALAGLIAIGALGLWMYYNSMDHPIVNGAPPILDYEIQAPAGAPLPDLKAVQVMMQAGEKGHADGWWDDQQTEQVDGRPVLTGHMQLYLRTSQRLVVVELPGGVNHLFQLRLPASPLGKKYQKWSEWQTSDFVFTPESRVGQKVAPEHAYRMRYLVEGMEH